MKPRARQGEVKSGFEQVKPSQVAPSQVEGAYIQPLPTAGVPDLLVLLLQALSLPAVSAVTWVARGGPQVTTGRPFHGLMGGALSSVASTVRGVGFVNFYGRPLPVQGQAGVFPKAGVFLRGN